MHLIAAKIVINYMFLCCIVKYFFRTIHDPLICFIEPLLSHFVHFHIDKIGSHVLFLNFTSMLILFHEAKGT